MAIKKSHVGFLKNTSYFVNYEPYKEVFWLKIYIGLGLS